MEISLRVSCILLVINCLIVVGICAPSTFDEQKGSWVNLKLYSKPGNLPPQVVGKDESIFVGISNYRDGRCSETLKNLYSKAKFPERVHVGIIQHINAEEDSLDCRADYCRSMGYPLGSGRCPYAENIRQLVDSFKDARGPGVSRYMQQRLLQREEFCLQVDAHSDFASEWDVEMLNTWKATDNEYAIISTRPTAIGDPALGEGELNHLCQAAFTPSGVIRNLLPRRARGLTQPLLAPLWSAAFSFSKCHAVRKVPYDPNLLFLFDGEEFTQMAKLWTHGYDVYSPSQHLVFHDDAKKMKGVSTEAGKPNKANRDVEWATHGQSPEYRRIMYDEAVLRVRTLLDMEGGIQANAESLASLQQYGLGTRRTLDQFQQFTGVDLRQGVLFADACTARQWVPFVADSHAEFADGDAWGFAAEIIPSGAADVPILRGGSVDMYLAAGATSVTKSEVTDAIKAGRSKLSATPPNPLKDHPVLWGLFLPIESLLESLLLELDGDVAANRPRAVRSVKLLLLLSPAIVLLVLAGYSAVTRQPFLQSCVDNSDAAGSLKSDIRLTDYDKNI